MAKKRLAVVTSWFRDGLQTFRVHSDVAFRKDLLAHLTAQPRSVSAIARELGLSRDDVEEDLGHIIRTAKAAGYHVVIRPAQCRACGFTFGLEKLRKPGKCPACRSTRLYEAQLQIEPPAIGHRS